MLSAFWFCGQYLQPQLPHFIVFFVGTFLTIVLGVGVGMVSADLLIDKIYLAEPLNSFQATMLGLDHSRFVEAEKLTEESRFELRTVFMVLIGALFGSQFILGQALNFYRTWILQRVNQDLRVAMMSNAVQVSLRYHHTHQVGDAIYRVYQDSAMVTAIVQTGLIQPVILFGTFSVALITISAFNAYLALLFLFSIIPSLILAKMVTARLRSRSRRSRLANSELTSHIQETVQGAKQIKAMQVEQGSIDGFVGKSKGALDRAYELRRLVVLLGLAVYLCTAIAVLLADYFMVQLVWAGSETTGYGLIALVGFTVWGLGAFNAAREQTGSASGSIVGMVNTWSLLQDMGVGLQRALFLLQVEPEVRDSPSASELAEGPVAVEFKNIAFGYSTEKSVLHEVSFRSEPGCVTAIVGSSGVGKSTLMNLLLRLYDVDSGSIIVGSHDVRELKQASLRSRISIVLQENALFPTTIRENIRFTNPIVSEEQLANAVYVSCVDEFLDDLPERLETELGERGAKLSTGQRQRISIARAILKDAPVLILDEPTASLDLKIEQLVLERIAEWAKDKVVFLITHRVATTMRADQVVYLEDGTVVEIGAPSSLLEKTDGKYRAFVDADLSAVI